MANNKKSRGGGGNSGKAGSKNGSGLKVVDKGAQTPSAPISNLIDLAQIRAQRNTENRRGMERFLIQQLVDVYCEQKNGDIFPIRLHEVSETGCSFSISDAVLSMLSVENDQLAVRIYFSKDSYLRVGLDVLRIDAEIGTGGRTAKRVACKLDTGFASYEAYKQFVRFVAAYSQFGKQDSRQISAG